MARTYSACNGTLWYDDSLTSWTIARGMTSRPTRRSATASDTINQLEGVRSLRTMLTAVQTSILPTIVPITIREQASAISAAAHTGYASPPEPSSVVLLLLLFTGVVMATAR